MGRRRTARGRTASGTSRTECPAAASAGVTYAPMLSTAELVPPGAPTVDSAGPELPADDTNMTPCLFTACAEATGVWQGCADANGGACKHSRPDPAEVILLPPSPPTTKPLDATRVAKHGKAKAPARMRQQHSAPLRDVSGAGMNR